MRREEQCVGRFIKHEGSMVETKEKWLIAFPERCLLTVTEFLAFVFPSSCSSNFVFRETYLLLLNVVCNP